MALVALEATVFTVTGHDQALVPEAFWLLAPKAVVFLLAEAQSALTKVAPEAPLTDQVMLTIFVLGVLAVPITWIDEPRLLTPAPGLWMATLTEL